MADDSPHTPQSAPKRKLSYVQLARLLRFETLPNDHPLKIALRTYALSLSFSLGPALFSLLVSRKGKGGYASLVHLLRRELGASGFAFAMTMGVGGGAVLKNIWDVSEQRRSEKSQDKTKGSQVSLLNKLAAACSSLSDAHKAFIANSVSALLAILLLQSGGQRRGHHRSHTPSPLPNIARRPSRTLDLTLLLFVRAMDAIVRAAFFPPVNDEQQQDEEAVKRVQGKQRRLTARIDALVFWAASARIMWCFFYQPQRLPRSYNKWIMALANIDPRILKALRAIREGDLSYTRNYATQANLLSSLANDLGYPPEWGDVTRIPAYGGPQAQALWQHIGITNRSGLGGIPCELVHGGVTDGSCTSNALIRGAQAFAEAIAIYLPVHALPILLTRPRRLFRLPDVVTTLSSVLRSASFLSTFVSSIWISVCLTRTLLLARLLPFISHDFWDGPLGCTFAGSLVCGSSIWIEQARRRGEMALYVLPRAIRALLPEKWLKGGKGALLLERLTFVLSLATLLTASSYQPESLRGLSRWTVAFVMHGPKVGFWKRKRAPTAPPTPVEPGSPQQIHAVTDVHTRSS